MPALTHDQLKSLIQQETDMFEALVEASNDVYIIHRAWRTLVLENAALKAELAKEILNGSGNQHTHDLGTHGAWSMHSGGNIGGNLISY